MEIDEPLPAGLTDPVLQFSWYLRHGEFSNAVSLLNSLGWYESMSLISSIDDNLANREFHHTFLDQASDDRLFDVLVGDILSGKTGQLQQDIVLAITNRGRQFFDHIDQRRLHTILYDSLTEAEVVTDDSGSHMIDNDYMILLKSLLLAGLDPNRRIDGESMIMTALEHRKYEVAELLLATPGFTLTGDIIAELDGLLIPRPRLRRQLVRQFGVAEPAETEISFKRGRYE